MSVVLSALPAGERSRERLRALGVEALSERELLALVLRNGRKGESAVDLAATLLATFGGLSGLACALPEELAAVPGVGTAKASSLVAALRLGMLTGRVTDQPSVLRSSADIAHVAAQHLHGLRRERVLVLICDGANQLVQVAGESYLIRPPASRVPARCEAPRPRQPPPLVAAADEVSQVRHRVRRQLPEPADRGRRPQWRHRSATAAAS